MNILRVALVQNNAGREVRRNLERMAERLADVSDVDLIALPEVFALRGREEELRAGAQPLSGEVVGALREWARAKQSWVLGGSVLERDGDAVYNTSLLINRRGDLVASYRKIHLFEVHMETGVVIREADVYRGGNEPVMADIDGWSAGLSVCYDVRFPELYRRYSKRGAHILFVPSNFTQRTGKDHWNVLIRARAIENQCFVVAPAQCGVMPGPDVETHGHSMAVGPWGEVLCEAGREECVLRVELDPALLDQTRARVPALQHRKLD